MVLFYNYELITNAQIFPSAPRWKGELRRRPEKMGTMLLPRIPAQQSPRTRLLRSKRLPWEGLGADVSAARASASCQSVTEDSME